MNRKEFVQSHGADCKNWNWSWSFVNHSERFVIFGVWQSEQENRLGCILRKNWEISAKGRKNNGYGQALEHIRLIEDDGYRLQTFPMRGVARNPQDGELSPAAIAEFTPELSEGRLVVLADGWYVAADHEVYETIADIIDADDAVSSFQEGAMFTVFVNGYERSPEARKACLRHHGLSCKCAMSTSAKRMVLLGKDTSTCITSGQFINAVANTPSIRSRTSYQYVRTATPCSTVGAIH
ncbi:hypothetical protein NKY68_00245 [Sinorhizobium meliloti]|uniref:hypothetical protein n=1 Tax=Rhizobium meliloti TaxID=382 RepID=UPI003D652B84